jgi:hypothetical protein
MDQRKLILILLFIVGASGLAFPQADTLFKTVARQEAVNLNLLWYFVNHGSISWEKSTDGQTWTTLPDQAGKNYHLSAESDSYYRASVSSGTCDPVYSRITKLSVLDLSTDSAGSVSNSGAVIYCTSRLDPAQYPERGILLDTKPVPDQSSTHFKDPENNNSFSISLVGLEEGMSYYVRVYAKDASGNFFPGNILSFSTLKISFTNILDATQTSARVFYSVSSTPAPTDHGVLFSETPDFSLNPHKISGTSENGKYSTLINELSAGTSYWVKPYMTVNGTEFTGEAKEIKTLSDYSGFTVDNTTAAVGHKIVWNDPSTARKISQEGYFADYGRVKRVGNSDTLILVYHGGPNNLDWLNICMRMSYDNGNTWTPQRILMNIDDHNSEYWRFCNPEILVLQNGWILIPYEANAKPDENKSCIQILISKDTCKTFEGPVIYPTGRTWEPAMVQLPNGEIEMFYSSEEKWWPGDPVYQEIRQAVSTDNGYSWSESQTVAYYPEKRDGMPVPLLLQGNKGVIFAIESVNSSLSPYIIKRDLASSWVLTTSSYFNNTYRWVISNFSGHGGAPYVLQLPTGEVALSAHIYRGGDWHQNNYMQVMLGDNNAKNFQQISSPWGYLPNNESAVNNSLFLKDSETLVAVSCRMFTNGSGGVYWIEGKIVPVK